MPVYRCHRSACPLYGKAYRSEIETRFAPPRTKYSLETICLAGFLSSSVSGTRPLQKLLAKHSVAIPVKSIPPILEIYNALLSGRSWKGNSRLEESLRTQGCTVLDVFMVSATEEISFWVIREFLSSTLLSITRYHDKFPYYIQRLVSEVGRSMPVPVIGFTVAEEGSADRVLQHILKYSGKNPARLVEVPSRRPIPFHKTSVALTCIVQDFLDYRNGKANQSRVIHPALPFDPLCGLPAVTDELVSDVMDLAHADLLDTLAVLQDWFRSGDMQHEGGAGNYDYNWNLYKGGIPPGCQ